MISIMTTINLPYLNFKLSSYQNSQTKKMTKKSSMKKIKVLCEAVQVKGPQMNKVLCAELTVTKK